MAAPKKKTPKPYEPNSNRRKYGAAYDVYARFCEKKLKKIPFTQFERDGVAHYYHFKRAEIEDQNKIQNHGAGGC